jgi:hypothetical protein
LTAHAFPYKGMTNVSCTVFFSILIFLFILSISRFIASDDNVNIWKKSVVSSFGVSKHPTG